MADTVNEILNDLDTAMLENFNEYASTLIDTWDNFSGNAGQYEIVNKHVREVVHEHVGDAKKKWPYGATPDDYLMAVYGCFDSEVMDRAFSETIESSYSQVYNYWLNSVDLQHEHEYVMSTIGASAEPHSTSANWGDG